VHGGSTNLSEQYVDEVPKSYGFNDLISQSVILADGTERRYYVLSEDYPLNQVTPPMPSSAVGKVGVTAAQSVAAQAAGLPPVLCSKANITTGSGLLVPNLPQPAKVQDAAHLFKEPPVYDIYEEDNSCLNCMDEQLATPFHKASENASREQLLTCFSKAAKTEQTSACLNIVTDVLDVTLEKQQQDDEKRANCSVIMASDSVVTWSSHFSIEHNLRELTLLWDPGASAFLHSSKGSTLSILQQLHNKKISSMQEFSLEKESHVQWDPGIKFILYELRWWSKRTEYALRHLLAVKFGTHNYSNFIYIAAIMCCLPANLIQQRRNIAALLHFWQYKLLSRVVRIWDPGIAISSYMYSWVEMTAVKTIAWLRPLLNYLQRHLPMSNISCDEDKFLHQQGVLKNYNAKQLLLSLRDGVTIREIGIIFFMTFRPP